MNSGAFAVECWACRVVVTVPIIHDRPAQTFKCGWCGALNELQQGPGNLVPAAQCYTQQPQQHAPTTGDKSQQSMQQHVPVQQESANVSASYELCFSPTNQQLQHRRRITLKHLISKCSSVCRQLYRWLIVVFVVLLIGSLAGTGILFLLPRLCTTWTTYLPNMALATVLLLDVLFNYMAAVLQSPGKVSDLIPLPQKGQHGEVLQGSYDLYTYCKPCRSLKPPQAHHCRTCGHCVVDMDHHCPFIGNCVGRGNLRPFLLFLFWTLVAAAYILIMCSVLIWQQGDVVSRRSPQHAHLGSRNSSVGRSSASSDSLMASAMHGMSISNMSAGNGFEGPRAQAHIVGMAQSTVHRPSNWVLATTGMFFVLLQLAPGWLLATYYLTVVAAALLLAIGMLLWSQLSYLARGMTYIQHLKGAAGSASGMGTEQQQWVTDSQKGFEHQKPQLLEVAVSASQDDQQMHSIQEPPARMRKQHEVQTQTKCIKLRTLWLRVKDVLGAGSTMTGLLLAVVVPRWQLVNGAPCTAKKHM